MERSPLVTALVFSALALSAQAEVQLKGLTIKNGEPLFSLYSTEDQTSKWVSLGQSFSGHKVLSFDPQQEALTLANSDSRQTIRMHTTALKDSSSDDAKARLQSLTGLDLAYDMAKRGDQDVAAALQAYQKVLTRLRELATAGTLSEPPAGVGAATKFLQSQSDELKREAEQMAAKKAALLLSAPAKP